MTEQTKQNRPADWVVLESFNGPVFAEMAKVALEAEGIPCFIRKDFLDSAYGVQGTGHPGLATNLLVPQEHLEQGRQILDRMGSDED